MSVEVPKTSYGDTSPATSRAWIALMAGIAMVATGTLSYRAGLTDGKNKLSNNSSELEQLSIGFESEFRLKEANLKQRALSVVSHRIEKKEPVAVYMGLTLFDTETVSPPRRGNILPKSTTSIPNATEQPTTTIARTTQTTSPAPRPTRHITLPDPIIYQENIDGIQTNVYLTYVEGRLVARLVNELDGPGTFTGKDAKIQMVSNYYEEGQRLFTQEGRPFGQIIAGEATAWPLPPN